jgi:hypothetical protein
MIGFDAVANHSLQSNTKNKTFRSKSNVQEGTRQKELLQFVEHTLKVAGDVRQAVKLPTSGSISITEWQAIHGKFLAFQMMSNSNFIPLHFSLQIPTGNRTIH